MKDLFVVLGDTYGDPVIHGIFTNLDAAKEAANKRGTMFAMQIQVPDIHKATLNEATGEFVIESHNAWQLQAAGPDGVWVWTHLFDPDEDTQEDLSV